MKITTLAMTALMLGCMATGGANAQGVNQDTAIDERDNVVVNTFGNCVRTKWQSDGDACAPAAKPVPQVAAPAPAPAPAMPSREARTIYFDFNKATLTPDSIAKLNDLVVYVSKSKQVDAAGIAGFADRIGGNDYNLELSKKRAKAVYEYLSSRVNIRTEILDMRAIGEEAPQTQCAETMKRKEQISCLAKDRRVEVVFQYQK